MLQTPAALANTCTGMSGTSNAEDVVPRTSGRGEQRDADVQSRRQMHGQNKVTATLSTEEESPRASVAVAFGPFGMRNIRDSEGWPCRRNRIAPQNRLQP